jgi:hypothetical protein
MLDLSVELSTRDIMAGSDFTLFVLVKNPFAVPVWIRRVQVSLPGELSRATEMPAREAGLIDRLRKFIGLNGTKETETEPAEGPPPILDDEHRQQLEDKVSALETQLAWLNQNLDALTAGSDRDGPSRRLQLIEGVMEQINLLREQIDDVLPESDEENRQQIEYHMDTLKEELINLREMGQAKPSSRIIFVDVLKETTEQLCQAVRTSLADAAEEKKEEIEHSITAMQAQLLLLEDVDQDLSAGEFDDRIHQVVGQLATDSQLLRQVISHPERGLVRVSIEGQDASLGNLRADAKNAVVTIRMNRALSIGDVEIVDSTAQLLPETKRNVAELESSLPRHIALQPGSTAVYNVVLRVHKQLLFSPAKYRLQFNVNYGFEPHLVYQPQADLDRQSLAITEIVRPDSLTDEGPDVAETLFTNTLAYELSIRASLYAVIIGAAIGGLAGAATRILQVTPGPSANLIFNPVNFMAMLVAMILSIIAIIFMARKSDTPSFVSVEDFWGGLLIGFLVGYTGATFFETVTG